MWICGKIAKQAALFQNETDYFLSHTVYAFFLFCDKEKSSRMWNEICWKLKHKAIELCAVIFCVWCLVELEFEDSQALESLKRILQSVLRTSIVLFLCWNQNFSVSNVDWKRSHFWGLSRKERIVVFFLINGNLNCCFSLLFIFCFKTKLLTIRYEDDYWHLMIQGAWLDLTLTVTWLWLLLDSALFSRGS